MSGFVGRPIEEKKGELLAALRRTGCDFAALGRKILVQVLRAWATQR
ncbi:hypothetical protein LJ655_10480 [Paraburkholderia sp. MMS20-SJTN17]|uniref:Uncharacterized protein n=1 Tax=Paraburkholderia translucens TaxID=2886945 RepID=A0ABS8KC64_9BURK|nr:hypothetical protein [Paraburkholderia sp. MMS20-SJTN17]MCC8402313.1 hypothetical protein [Paraburkholderia sp. MMS20-SJTN17]